MKEQVLEALSAIIDPDLGKDIVSLGFIKDLVIENGKASFAIELTTPACPVKDTFKKLAEEFVLAVEGINAVDVTMTAQPKKNALVDADKVNLQKVSNIIAVSSCKGGVGKSTVAVNLAYTLKQQGASVGIFDADVYGPSLPTMLKSDQPLALNGDLIQPIEVDGVKCVSFGHAVDQSDEGPAILRGPMVTQIISQFLLQTNWGELDYLIIDMPPGTGDVQITLCQIIPITAAVIVTTPQYISFIDVIKGIEMFDTLKVPVVGVVENMSFIQHGEEKIFPFGKGSLDRLIKEFGFKNTVQLECDPKVSECGDNGRAYVESYPETTNKEKLHSFTEQVVREVAIINNGQLAIPKIGFSKEDGVLIQKEGEKEIAINAKALRLACRSALTRDEFSNEMKITADEIPDDIHPLSMNPVGNYALGVNWSDGHSSLYPYEQLLEWQG